MPNKEHAEVYEARWSLPLQMTTLAWLIILGCTGMLGYEHLNGHHRYWFASTIMGYIIFCWIMRVKAYRLRGTYIEVVRPLYTTRINAQNLRKMRLDGSAMQGVVPIFANLGMFCFNGWFHSEKHGIVRAFITDKSNIVRVKLNDQQRMYMFSPEDPEHFLHTLRNNTRPTVRPDPEA